MSVTTTPVAEAAATPSAKPATDRGQASADLPVAVRRLSGALGAEVGRRDGTAFQVADADQAQIAELRALLCEHQVLVLRDQQLDAEGLAAFARQLGPIERHEYIRPLDDTPDVVAIIKEPGDVVNFGGGWHSDMSYLPQPPMATALLAVETPEFGGDTLFASQHAAYLSLSDPMKRFAESLTATHSARRQYGSGGDSDKRAGERESMDLAVAPEAQAEVSHPVVRTHPETGRKGLYVNFGFTERIDGLRRAESNMLLRHLLGAATTEATTCRVQWQPGTLTMWDNRSVQHYALNDYQGQRRHMLRVTIGGDTPV